SVVKALFFLHRWRRKRFSVFKDLGILGPTPSLFSGNLSELVEKGAARCFEEWTKKYGDIVGFYNGGTPMLIVKDLDLIKRIQIKDFGNFHGRGVTSRISRDHQVSKLSLVNVDGDRWKDMRSLLTPAFTSSNMKKISRLMDTSSDEFLEVLDSLHERDEAFEIRQVFQKLTMDVIVRSAFGVQSDVQKNPEMTGMNVIIKEILEGLTLFRTGWVNYLSASFPEFSFIWRLVLTWRRRVIGSPFDNVNYGIIPIINMRRSNPQANLLQLMLNAEAEEGAAVSVHQLTVGYEGETSQSDESKVSNRKRRVLTNAEIQSNAIVFLVAGFETTSTALTFTTYLLAKFQDVQDRLRSEITTVLKKDGKFTYDNVFSMRYLDQVISESLRFYPPVTGFPSKCCQFYLAKMQYNGREPSLRIKSCQISRISRFKNMPNKYHVGKSHHENKYTAYDSQSRNVVPLKYSRNQHFVKFAKYSISYCILSDQNILLLKLFQEDHLKLGSSFVFCYPQDGAWLKVKKI
ncbi:unnamed protein product, partial [Ixodes hexagonus]